MENLKVIGQSVDQIDVRQKVTGKAIYNLDFQRHQMLWGKIKRSPHPFAKIVHMDISRAQRLPGVKAVLTGTNCRQFLFGITLDDQLPLAAHLVRYVGDEVAAVAAVDEEVAEEALDLIDVQYEELPALLDPADALHPKAPAVHPELPQIEGNVPYALDYTRGDPDGGFKEADLVLEENFATQRVHQLYLEPHSCVAEMDASGRLILWGSLQAPFRARPPLAKALGIPEEKIRLIMNTVGGGFGGKGGNLLPLYPICALLAMATGKPVKVALTREEEFFTTRPRLATRIRLKMGFKKDGMITSKDFEVVGDVGAYLGGAPALLISTATRTGSLYRMKNIRARARLVYTNKLPAGAFRGFGSPQMHFAVESLMDTAAAKLGLDPVEIRLRNGTEKGDVTVHGWRIHSCALKETLKDAARRIGWKEKRKKPQKGRGVGLACMVHVAGNRGFHPYYDGSAAYVKIDECGRVLVLSGEMDLGQGCNTIFAQIVSEELGIPMENVEVAQVDTETSPFGLGTFADRVTVLGGNAVRLAARDAKKKLLEAAANLFEAQAEDMELRDGKIHVIGAPAKSWSLKEVAARALFQAGGLPIMGIGSFTVPPEVEIPDPKTKYGNLSLAYSFGTQAAEVEVDRETGQVRLIKYVSVHDSGKIINHKLAAGQVYGGVVQGLGYALMEGYKWEGGRVLNPNYSDYKTLSAMDLPEMETVFIEAPDPSGPYGAKGLGEPTLVPTAPAIANAIYNAVGVRIRDLPITMEKIQKALREKADERNR